MGYLNSTGNFQHWFGNIHFSGKCNRSCYYCIGQHMMALDKLDNLTTFPPLGIDAFIHACNMRGVNEINLTGSNTDPLLYKYPQVLRKYLEMHIPDLILGVRTNGVYLQRDPGILGAFDKMSVSVTSLNPEIYRATMGSGSPPDITGIVDWVNALDIDLKINIVLCPEILGLDLECTLRGLSEAGVKRVNLREPYGQPHIGDPLKKTFVQVGKKYGMPHYFVWHMDVVYWDVHYVEVESVNLYASGTVSGDYPITKGHDKKIGVVKGQEHFTTSGRIQEQWICQEPEQGN